LDYYYIRLAVSGWSYIGKMVIFMRNIRSIRVWIVRCEDGQEDILELYFNHEKKYVLLGEIPPRKIFTAESYGDAMKKFENLTEQGLWTVLEAS